MRIFLTISLFLLSTNLFSQINLSAVDINSLSSKNNKYSLLTAPYSNYGLAKYGRTTVYYRGKVQYIIPRYFPLNDRMRYLFVDNSGEYLVYIVSHNRFQAPFKEKAIQIFRNGSLFASFSLAELIGDSLASQNQLFFDNVVDSIIYPKTYYSKNANKTKIQAYQYPVRANDNKILIFATHSRVIELEFTSGKIKSYPLNEVKEQDLTKFHTLGFSSIKHPVIHIKHLKTINSNESIQEDLANFLGLKLLRRGYSDLFVEYGSKISFLIDRKGKCSDIEIEANQKLPKDSIELFFNNNVLSFSYTNTDSFLSNHLRFYNNNELNDTVDKWLITIYPTFTESDLNLAKKIKLAKLYNESEIYKKEQKIKLVADSIGGNYIPRDIEDCFKILNKLLSKEKIQKIKSLESHKELINYHFGLGMWLRNSWGLWGGSRLKEYFEERNVTQPDGMSSLILLHYYDWLNGRNKDWRRFDKLQ